MILKNVISFSLWGNNELYTQGAIHNIHLAKKFFPDWVCRFHIDKETVPTDVVRQIKDLGAEVVLLSGNHNTLASMWRFSVMFDETVDRFMIRDADSRIFYREKLSVEDWIKSGKDFHIMRDYPFHNISILAGMWGGRVSACRQFKSVYCQWINNSNLCFDKGVDQDFLHQNIWQKAKKSMLCHDRVKNYFDQTGQEVDFPIPLEGNCYVGSVRCGEERGDTAYANYQGNS